MTAALGTIKKCAACRKYARHDREADRCVTCAASPAKPAPPSQTPEARREQRREAAVRKLLKMSNYAFMAWVMGERERVISRSKKDVIADFGEQGFQDWALEVGLGLNDAAVLEDHRLLARANALEKERRDAGKAPWEWRY